MRSLIPILTFAVSLAAAAAFGGQIHVPGDALTIELGLAAASPGDSVIVECGTYYENGLELPSGVTLISEYYDPDCVTIDGGGTDVILTCNGITGAAVLGFRFTNGSNDAGGAVHCTNASVLFDLCRFYGNHASTSGGAVYWSEGTPEITGCTFNDNDSGTVGGALSLYVTDGSITDCQFADNVAQRGGGVFAYQLGTTTTFTECEFETNRATDEDYGGGAVYNDNLTGLTFIECRFELNEGNHGGAVFNDLDTTPTYVDCEFNENTALNGGGAGSGYEDETEFDGCEFTLNVAAEGAGGALYFDHSNSTVTGCSFYMNEGQSGGAIASTSTTLAVTSTTIAENTVTTGTGGAGLFLDYSSLTIDRVIIAFNRGGEAVTCTSASFSLFCTDIFGNDGGDWVDCITGLETSGGNLDVDPLFCNLPEYELTLCADSECLPDFNECSQLLGAWPEGCAACGQPVEGVSWGAIKVLYR